MKRILAASFLLYLCNQSFAAFPVFFKDAQPSKLYVGMGAGEMFSKVSGGNYLGTGDGWPDDHYTTNGISDQPFGFLALGFTWVRDDIWLPNYSLGLRYQYISTATVIGAVDQYSLPGFRNYLYSYDIQLLNVLAILKADLYRWQNLMPYVTLGAGIANFYTSQYSEQATSGVTPRVNPGFGGNSSNNFAYQLGLGVDYALNQNVLINVEYDYADFGTVRTGKGANYSTLTGTNYDNESLKNKITANTLFLGLTYYPA